MTLYPGITDVSYPDKKQVLYVFVPLCLIRIITGCGRLP